MKLNCQRLGGGGGGGVGGGSAGGGGGGGGLEQNYPLLFCNEQTNTFAVHGAPFC